MIDNTSLSEFGVRTEGESQFILVSLKQSFGQSYIDVRKWVKSPFEEGKRMPTKGMMARTKQWPQIIEAVQKLLIEAGNIHG